MIVVDQHPRIGGLKLLEKLRPALLDAGIGLGRDRLFDLLRSRQMLVAPKKKSVRTTYYDSALPVFRNQLYELAPSGVHQAWVADITYIDTDQGPLYLTLLTDLYSRMIVGFNCAETLVAAESIEALMMAIDQLPPGFYPTHHSDRGCQFCSHEYVGTAQAAGLSISMTEQNHCYENCYAERVNGILKGEYNLDLRFRSKAQARRAVAQAIELYNHDRPHLSLQMHTPAQIHQAAA
ncbi:IS3 family transposase [Congregicoccus parvus]|uniref:IS3 family transposase n=1 Tax=Congregicoccus parvus TaxID=3081749 RepID=UPI003FA5B414